MKTSELIDTLARTATPVKRLRPPLLRAATWLALAVVILVLLAVAEGLRPDLAIQLRQGMFITAMAATLLTAVLAALAAFKLSLPETSRWWLLVPLPALAVWISTIGYGCLTDWVDTGANGVHAGEAAQCFATLLMTSVPLAIALLLMLRHAAALRPSVVSAMGGLAVAAITAFVLALIHRFDATVMILIWNLGAAALVALVAGLCGRRFFNRVRSRLPTVS